MIISNSFYEQFIILSIPVKIINQEMNSYSVQNKLGQGAFSVVYKVQRKEDGEEYAMKKIRIMSLQEKEVANCLNEVRILASIQSPYIIQYKDSFFDEVTNTFCIVTQLLSGGDLQRLISQYKSNKKLIPQSLIWRYAIQTISALYTLHQARIFHRDIKPANIFLADTNTAKLGDMNVSIVTSNGMAKTQTGTPYYASPQVWNERPYNAKCDIWSLGCVLYELATLKPPFNGSDMKSLKKSILQGYYKSIPPFYSSELSQLIKICLQVDHKDRLSAEQLLRLDSVVRKTHSLQMPQIESTTKKILQIIQAPRRNNFRIVKDRLPKSRFLSVERTLQTERQKQNIKPNEIKGEMRRSVSGTRRRLVPMRQGQVKKNEGEKPPLPKTKLLRA